MSDVIRARRVATAFVCVAMIGVAACSGGSGKSAKQSSTTTTRPRPRLAGPAADMSHELSGGNGVFIGEGAPTDLAREGYVQREYVASGTATAYQATGALTGDGRWTFTPDGNAPY